MPNEERGGTSSAAATVGDLTEAALIARIRQRLPPPPDWLLVGIGDDAAVIAPERNRIEVLTVDAVVEGIHFDRAFVPPDAIGHRALAVNLSDLAAMGAAPRLALLSFALPPRMAVDEFDGIAAGLTRLAAAHQVHVVGGNLTRSPGPLMIDVTVLGTVKPRKALTRAGARPGDAIYVSGTIGAAAAGLEMLRERSTSRVQDMTREAAAPPGEPENGCVERYLYTEPRVRLGVQLARNRAASAAIDLSDGLTDGLHQLADSSGVGAIIDADALPIDDAVRAWFGARGLDPVAEAMSRGDDYELLFTVRPRTGRQLETARRHGGAPLTRIGTCTAARPVVLLDQTGERALPRRGYSHFGGTAETAQRSDGRGE